MEKSLKYKQIIFYWHDRKISYCEESGVSFNIVFFRPANRKIDLFKWCAIIAIAQNISIIKQDYNYWDGAGETLYGSFKKEFSWEVNFRSLLSYYSSLRSGKSDRDQWTTIIKEGNSSALRYELFQNEDSKCYFGPREPIGKGQHKYIEITFTNIDKEFDQFQSTVMELLDSPEIASLFKKTKPRFAEVIIQRDESEYDLKSIIKNAKQSIFIAGQNLYSLVESACSNLKGKTDYLAELKNWLEQDKENRCLNILLCDPSSKVAVLYYSMVHTPLFIDHLCSSIKEFKHWKQELANFNVNIKVTDVIPSSVSVIDEALDTITTIITPLLFEPRAQEKIRFLLKNAATQSVGANIYTMYHQRLINETKTRNIEDVTDKEIEYCRNYWKEYEKSK